MIDFFRFEIEHIFGKALWNDTHPEIAKFLRDNGYRVDMSGNQIALFSDPLFVERLQALPHNDPLRRALLNPKSNWSINRHEGRAPDGGNQLGKDEFLKSEIERIRTSNASPEAKQAGLDNLHDLWAANDNRLENLLEAA